jgi:hypothetical protein
MRRLTRTMRRRWCSCVPSRHATCIVRHATDNMHCIAIADVRRTACNARWPSRGNRAAVRAGPLRRHKGCALHSSEMPAVRAQRALHVVWCVGSARPHGSHRAPLSQPGRHVLTKSRCRIVRWKARLAHPYSDTPPWPTQAQARALPPMQGCVVPCGTVGYWLVLWLSQERIHGIKGWNLVERRRRFVCEARMCTVSATKTLKTVQHRCACCMVHRCIRRAVAPSCCLLTAMVGLRRAACRYGSTHRGTR